MTIFVSKPGQGRNKGKVFCVVIPVPGALATTCFTSMHYSFGQLPAFSRKIPILAGVQEKFTTGMSGNSGMPLN